MKISKKNTATMLALVASQTSDRRVLQDVRRMQKRLEAKSMTKILKKVPGETIKDKCRVLGITRTTYYSWINGVTRPRTEEIVAKLAGVTGVRADVIRGA